MLASTFRMGEIFYSKKQLGFTRLQGIISWKKALLKYGFISVFKICLGVMRKNAYKLEIVEGNGCCFVTNKTHRTDRAETGQINLAYRFRLLFRTSSV
jgi:hypothetical protein